MEITFQNGQDSLHFDEQGRAALLEQVNKDAIFQERLKIAIIIGLLLFFAASCATCGLAVAGVIPYGVFSTCVACFSFTEACSSLVAYTSFHGDLGAARIAYMTNRPLYSDLAFRIREAKDAPLKCTRAKTWTYLKKCHQEYNRQLLEAKKEMRKILDEQFNHSLPKDSTTHEPIYTFPEIANIAEGYL